MELATYMKLTGKNDAAFAKEVGRERSSVTRWRLKKTRPDWDALKAIERATDGAVTANDFVTTRSETAA